MVDAYLMIRPWNRLTSTARAAGKTETDPASNNVGDIIEIRGGNRTPWSTKTERTKFYFLKVTSIPNAVALKVKARLSESDRPANIRRIFGLAGGDVRPAQALSWLETNYPAAAQNFRDYFNGTVEQPESDVLSVSWATLRDRVWHKVKGRLATQAELES